VIGQSESRDVIDRVKSYLQLSLFDLQECVT